MVVQQRTMTTGLDGVTQQTVVQQQMAAPAITPAALFHANAMRQRTLMQQRGIRYDVFIYVLVLASQVYQQML